MSAISTPTPVYSTPENISAAMTKSPAARSASANKLTARRKLYTPRTRSTLQITRASNKVKAMNSVLRDLHFKNETARKRNHTMQEYRNKLKIATVESVKCMYVEYIQRKQTELVGYVADACHRETNFPQFFTPPRNAGSRYASSSTERVVVQESPLASPLD